MKDDVEVGDDNHKQRFHGGGDSVAGKRTGNNYCTTIVLLTLGITGMMCFVFLSIGVGAFYRLDSKNLEYLQREVEALRYQINVLQFTTKFTDDSFAVYSSSGGGIPSGGRAMFNASMINGTVTRTFVLPNRDGTVALLTDVKTLLGNNSLFLDSGLVIASDPDMTRRAVFDASGISAFTTQTFAFPDTSGTLALDPGARVGFRVRKSGLQSITSTPSIVRPWAVDISGLDYNAGYFDLDAGSYNVSTTRPGLYLVCWNIGWISPSNVAGGRADLYVNGDIVNAMHILSEVAGWPSLSSSQWGSTFVPLVGGDIVTIRASNTPGAIWTIDGSGEPLDPLTTWSMEYIRS